MASREPDHDHPYGHGKAEAVAAMLAGIGLVVSAIIIAYHAIREMFSPHLTPALFTVPALIAIILAKEALFRFTSRGAASHDRGGIIHDFAFALLVGILIAVIAGPEYAFFDDLAACMVTGLILFNAWRIIRPALDELMDRRIEDEEARAILAAVL